jgi:hypothetical protein
MITLRKDVLRESIEICRQSNLYEYFTREERREAVMHVYHIINEYQAIGGKALGYPWEFQSVSLQT